MISSPSTITQTKSNGKIKTRFTQGNAGLQPIMTFTHALIEIRSLLFMSASAYKCIHSQL